jgi:hypothetical protein
VDGKVKKRLILCQGVQIWLLRSSVDYVHFKLDLEWSLMRALSFFIPLHNLNRVNMSMIVNSNRLYGENE